jgi:4a-hydroxytetrahydrobiopterin dehydratase
MEGDRLAAKHCVPCEAGTPPLDIHRARELMGQVPGWELKEPGEGEAGVPMLIRRFKFKDFAGAMEFVNEVAGLAESEGHHPDIHIAWNRVRLELTTHAIKGLSDNDFVLAAKVNVLRGEG